MNHFFIVFEGVDGSGKSEVSAKLSEKIDAIYLESPAGEFKKIREYVDCNLNEKGRFLFYLASNFDLSSYVRQKRSNQTIICARYFHSTMIGYASRQSINIEDFYKFPPISLDDLENPDITFFLYVNEEIQCIRIQSRESNSKMDYKCLNNANYRKKLFNNYNYIAARENWICIDTSYMSIDEVVDACISKILIK
jgi:dTMP kinase